MVLDGIQSSGAKGMVVLTHGGPARGRRGSAVMPRRVTTVAPRLLATATEPAATHSFYRIGPWGGL